jgi:hypothetical protein
MNIINNFIKLFNSRRELMLIQEINDNKIKYLECKNIIANFILFEREITREQIKNSSKYSFFNLPNYLNQVNDKNSKNLLYLKKILELEDSFKICFHLEQITNKKLDDYSNESLE